MFARLDSLDRPFSVQMVRQRIVNDIDIGIGQQLRIRPVSSFNLVFAGIFIGLVL